jgi:hypothetical protein
VRLSAGGKCSPIAISPNKESVMKRLASPAVLAILAVLGCGTIFSGGPDPLMFRSDPEGARVFVNGQEMGTTPLTLELDASKQYVITFRREGYEDATASLGTHVQAGWVVLDILVGVIGVAIDAATGDWKAFDSGDHFVKLSPRGS